jgi:hypothetical protein
LAPGAKLAQLVGAPTARWPVPTAYLSNLRFRRIPAGGREPARARTFDFEGFRLTGANRPVLKPSKSKEALAKSATSCR